jgi:hypothetical protein
MQLLARRLIVALAGGTLVARPLTSASGEPLGVRVGSAAAVLDKMLSSWAELTVQCNYAEAERSMMANKTLLLEKASVRGAYNMDSSVVVNTCKVRFPRAGPDPQHGRGPAGGRGGERMGAREGASVRPRIYGDIGGVRHRAMPTGALARAPRCTVSAGTTPAVPHWALLSAWSCCAATLRRAEYPKGGHRPPAAQDSTHWLGHLVLTPGSNPV